MDDGTPASRPAAGGAPYLPALDGIRAYAVLLIILFHFGIKGIPGGFLTVDLFFTLSGYLITRILVSEWERHGRLNLRQFWVRRAKRLLPALIALLLGVAVYALYFGAPDQRARTTGDAWSTMLYVTNWRFIATGQDYWDQFAVSPLRHAWTLAIEEQFYLLWPLVVTACIAIGARRAASGARTLRLRRQLLVIAAVGAVLSSLSMAFWWIQAGSTRSYYGTDTRVAAIFFGVALACILPTGATLPDPRMRRAVAGAGSVALVALFVFFLAVNETSTWMYRGGWVLADILCVLVVAGGTQGVGLTNRLLSTAPMRGIGLISYGLYLWHWPIMLVVNQERTGLDGAALMTLRLALTFAAALLSYVLVEQPVRTGKWPKLALRITTPVVAVALVLVFAFITSQSIPGGAENNGVKVARADGDRIAAKKPGASRTLVVGDSMSGNVAAALGLHGPSYGLDVVNGSIGGCGIARGDAIRTTLGVEEAPKCHWDDRWPEMIRRTKPDAVVLVAGSWDLLDRKIGDSWLRFGTPEWDAFYNREWETATNILTGSGATLIVGTFPPLDMKQSISLTGYMEHDNRKVAHLNALIENNARSRGYSILDLASELSPDGEFHAELNGVVVRHQDRLHLSPAGIDVVGKWAAPVIAKDLGRTATVATSPARVAFAGDTRLSAPLAQALIRVPGNGFTAIDPPRRPCSLLAPQEGCPFGVVTVDALATIAQPDVVVFTFGPDDVVPISGFDVGTPEWNQAVEGRIEYLLRTLERQRLVAVALRTPTFAAVDPINTEYLNVAMVNVARRNPDLLRVAELGVLNYGSFEPVVDGVVVRSDDGVGLTPEGADRLIAQLAPEIAAMGRRADRQPRSDGSAAQPSATERVPSGSEASNSGGSAAKPAASPKPDNEAR